MARPRKNRRVCYFPRNLSFAPVHPAEGESAVILSVDEYETIRLIDLEGFSQEACGEWMGIARTTVQMIYTTARQKLAQMLVEGKSLQITGGDYRLCDGAQDCGQNLCFKQYYSRKYEKPTGCIRAAIPCDGGEISHKFENARQIQIYDLREGEILASRALDTAQTDGRLFAGVLTALQTDILICDTLGEGTKLALTAAGIREITGSTGAPDAAVLQIL